MGTQITVLRLHDSVTLEHEFFAEGQHFKEILKEIGVQPGFSRGFWGLEDEDPTVVRVFVNWDPSDCIGNKYAKFISSMSCKNRLLNVSQ
jgi:hypothetical protein